MSITINTIPANIDNSAAFSVTTSLIEDSTHVNLRIRADVYHEGIVKAVVEKPKGLNSFDFGDILKSLVPGLKLTKGASALEVCGTVDANLLTTWTAKSGTYTTLTKTDNIIASAICTVSSVLESNAVTMAIGELYLLYAADFVQTGTAITVLLDTGGSAAAVMATNKGILIMPTSAGSLKINIGNVATQNFSGTFLLHKITTSRTTIGGLLAPYFMNFTEVYEDAAGATQTGATANTKVLRYVPAKGDGIAFTEYVLHDATSRFANKTLRNNVTKQFNAPITGVAVYKYELCFFTEFVDLWVTTSNGFAGSDEAFICYEGWGVIRLYDSPYTLAGGTYTVRIKDSTHTLLYSELLTVYFDMTTIDERVVLEFDGLVGGKEYLAFEGLKDQNFVTNRVYSTGPKKNRKPIKFDGICRQKLETLFKDQANTEYLKSILISEDVKRLEASYAVSTDVTVITDNVTINKGRELFTNQIEIEYEY